MRFQYNVLCPELLFTLNSADNEILVAHKSLNTETAYYALILIINV